MSAALIRHSGRVGKGMLVAFTYNLATGQIHCEHNGRPGRSERAQVLRRYRALRFVFLQKVAAAVGGSVAVIELDEHGAPDGVLSIDAPAPGHA